MSCDKLVFDLSQEVEGSPNVFIRKDWLNILDNQNQNYQNNQSIIDTSQLANSNKYMSYREAYLSVPMLLSLSTAPGTAASVLGDYSIGLKNWFGSIIHSMTLDYNGTTIVQQTPFCNMWNSFKLLTTLSWADVCTQGATIGFYPDTSSSWGYWAAASGNGLSVCNNDLSVVETNSTSLVTNNYTQCAISNNIAFGGNKGFITRTRWIAYGAYAGSVGGVNSSSGVNSQSYITCGVSSASCNQIWKSYIHTKTLPGLNTSGTLQISVMGTIYLKHIHSFFNMCPLLKGVFMKLTLNLNNCNSTITVSGATTANPILTPTSSTSYIGGVVPIMIPSARTGSQYITQAGAGNGVYTYDLMVGAKSYNTSILSSPGYTEGQLSKSIYLYVPSYTFNPTFEQAYLSNNIKQIKYTDIYQYQILDIAGGGNSQFNNLITNGIANIKSVLIIPFFSKDASGNTYNEFQSPFDTAGCGTTAPMVTLGNFNVQISGQNAIYNMQRYSFEEWNNQLYGQNAVNGGLTDGLTSGLIDFSDFQHSYCYYYVNVERMLPVEQSVPKSVQILGTNYSQRAINLWVFIEYGVSVSIDVLTGARV